MKKKTLILLLLATLLMVDLGYSFLQYVNYPTDGDMPSHLMPVEGFQKVINSPLGLSVFSEVKQYPDPNRFFMHYPYYVVMNGLPKFISNFTTPVDAVYLSMGIVKISVHMLLLFLIVVFINGGVYLKSTFFWLSTIIVSAFFNANAHSIVQIGIVDPTITYLFAYSFQMIFVLIYFLPLILKHYYKRPTPRLAKWKFLWIPLALIINLGSPLTPGIVLVVALVYAIYHTFNFLKTESKSVASYFKRVPSDVYFYLIPAAVFALYSLFIGTYNANTLLYADQMTTSQAYKLLPYGIYNQFVLNKGYLTLVLVVLGGMVVLSRHKDPEVIRFRNIAFWSMLFIVIYIALLPLGGYKPYRPYSLRFDTALPVTLILIILFGQGIRLLQKSGINRYMKWGYVAVTIVLVGWLFKRDIPEFWRDDLEKEAFKTIAASDQPIVEIGNQRTTILNWSVIESPELSKPAGQLLQRWGITKEAKQFYQIKDNK